MKPAKRYPLLFGPYRTPKFKFGDIVICECRGRVTLCGLTDARISAIRKPSLTRSGGLLRGLLLSCTKPVPASTTNNTALLAPPAFSFKVVGGVTNHGLINWRTNMKLLAGKYSRQHARLIYMAAGGLTVQPPGTPRDGGASMAEQLADLNGFRTIIRIERIMCEVQSHVEKLSKAVQTSGGVTEQQRAALKKMETAVAQWIERDLPEIAECLRDDA